MAVNWAGLAGIAAMVVGAIVGESEKQLAFVAFHCALECIEAAQAFLPVHQELCHLT